MFDRRPREKRNCERIPSDLHLKFFYENAVYFGAARNVSEGGMFITSKMAYCRVGSEFKIFIPYRGDVFFTTVRVRRIIQTDDNQTGLGVELLDHPHKYLDLLNRLKNKDNLEFTDY